ncbi:NADH-quinone oxidoreductase subunit C [Streptomyces sp. GB4-14]|uniref:NADH-quinone oxidoreductase subunit C n=1 Tax=Streptomyces sp. GB4-14 TaxID=2498703 RepID=UPI001F5F6A0E|nr:NADH-quinone oxidoreductase subunit C [Streptomyces sp. GB4-14]
MTAVGWLPADVEDLFGAQATAEEAYGVLTVDVPSDAWIPALEAARDRLGCTFFDWLSAVDEPGTGFRVTAHVVALSPVRRLLLRTTVPHETPVLPSAVDVYAGAAWHERETHEMFGVDFTGHPGLDHLLLPDNFEGHPLRKDFVLAARVAKAWPGAKEPGESEHGGPKRRQMLPPGVPDPNEWGPLKGQLPPAPARPARRTATASARTTSERPPRRTRSVSEGSASQTAGAGAGSDATAAEPPAAPRRARSVSEGSASQREAGGSGAGAAGTGAPRRARSASEGSGGRRPDAPSRRSRSASEGSVSQREGAPGTGGPRRARSASEGSASQRAEQDQAPAADDTAAAPSEEPRDRKPPVAPRSPDAPWHHARPAFEEPEPKAAPRPEPGPEARPEPGPEARPEPGPAARPEEPENGSRPEPDSPDPNSSDPSSPDPSSPDPNTPDDPSGGTR